MFFLTEDVLVFFGGDFLGLRLGVARGLGGDLRLGGDFRLGGDALRLGGDCGLEGDLRLGLAARGGLRRGAGFDLGLGVSKRAVEGTVRVGREMLLSGVYSESGILSTFGVYALVSRGCKYSCSQKSISFCICVKSSLAFLKFSTVLPFFLDIGTLLRAYIFNRHHHQVKKL